MAHLVFFLLVASWTANQKLAVVWQADSCWDNRIQVTQDVVNGGQLPGLVGRLYLFGEEFGIPLKAEGGSVAIDLYDMTHVPPGTSPKRLERWEIDADTMAKLLRRDKIGWGYSLFLPWSTYRPEITHVRLNICYTPAKGTPVYAEPALVTLRNDAPTEQVQRVSPVPK
jgi:hypothetical protein